MKASIAKIKSKAAAALNFTFNEAVDAAAYGYDDFIILGSVSVDGSLRNLGLGPDNSGEYRADLSYHAEIELICSRCGKRFSQPAAGEVSAHFVDGQLQEEDGEEELFFIKDGAADLAEVILSDIFFALPMQPLCKEDCRGLCPKCGVDLNVNDCSCDLVDIDPRWEKLKNLLPTED